VGCIRPKGAAARRSGVAGDALPELGWAGPSSCGAYFAVDVLECLYVERKPGSAARHGTVRACRPGFDSGVGESRDPHSVSPHEPVHRLTPTPRNPAPIRTVPRTQNRLWEGAPRGGSRDSPSRRRLCPNFVRCRAPGDHPPAYSPSSSARAPIPPSGDEVPEPVPRRRDSKESDQMIRKIAVVACTAVFMSAGGVASGDMISRRSRILMGPWSSR